LKIFLVLLIFFSLNSQAQSKVGTFFTLSSPEKCWVLFHPFKAKKAFEITKITLVKTDSLAKENVLTDINGGKLDAFKHSFWMASLGQKIGSRASLKLGKAHEKGNYKTFKKNQLEDGFLPDQKSSEMDLYNNKVGAKIGDENKMISQKELVNHILSEIQNGTMKVLKKDVLGNFLACDGDIIPKDSLQGKWENNKCLVFSNDEI